MIYEIPRGFFVNLSYKLSGTYNLVNQVSKKKHVLSKANQVSKKANLKQG